ncbi:CpsD/CapB family tyrosine-protein kinase, partial [Dolichospermum sp. UHCC 0260]|nr:CpsD/CapB family tyrosine-protein kinase [Dolichospermum sp. UHCC 0260]
YVDGLLLVVRPGKVEYSAVKSSKSLLNHGKVPILGMVVNGVSEESSYGGYYYQRGYYGEKVDSKKKSSQANLR